MEILKALRLAKNILKRAEEELGEDHEGVIAQKTIIDYVEFYKIVWKDKGCKNCELGLKDNG